MKDKIITLLDNAIDVLDKNQIEQFLEQPPKPELGDYAFPCFRLAKELRKAPQQIAADIKDSIACPDYIDKIEVQGAYINFLLKRMHMQRVLSKEV